jgi:hypothetical protein
MAKHALTSSSFVINAMYTYTFGNTLFLMSVKEGTQSFAYKYVEISAPRIICGSMMLVMTLRYFFGNNSFLTKVLNDSAKKPWVRFYHFICILLESLLLLATSYFVPYSTKFVYSLTALIAVEVFWYVFTRAVDRDSVVLADTSAHRAFFWNEMTNAGFVASVAIVSAVSCTKGLAWLIAILIMFLANTAYDVYNNMPSYMD